MASHLHLITLIMVPRKGLEPSHLSIPASKTGASTNSAIWAHLVQALIKTFGRHKSIASLLIIFQISMAHPVHAGADCADSLKIFLQQKAVTAKDLRKFGELADEYRTLWNTPLSSYFEEQSLVSLKNGSALEHSLMSQENVDKLFKDFDRMTTMRESVDGISIEFLPWWKANRDFYIKTGWIQGVLQKSHLSLSDLHFEMYLQFVAQPGKIKKAAWIRRMTAGLKPRAVIGTVLVATVFVLKEFKNIAIMGTGVQAYNGYMATVNAQIVNKAQQVGADKNGPFAEWLNERLNSKGNINAAQANLHEAVIELANTNFDKMNPEEAADAWDKSEQKLFALYQEYQKVLPAHLRDARSHFREVGLEAPLKYATSLATFEIQYREAKKSFDAYAAKTSFTSEELKDRDYQKAIMESAQLSMATTLATWKIVEFLYREVGMPEAGAGSNKELLNVHKKMSGYLSYTLYAKQYQEQMNIILKDIGFRFLAFDAAADEIAKGQQDRAPDSVEKTKQVLKKTKIKKRTSLKDKLKQAVLAQQKLDHRK